MTGTSGSTNTGTTISIASAGNYVVDPFTPGSTLTGTPSSSTPSGYGWRTAGIAGVNVPAGTWNFKVTTQSTALATIAGDAHMGVYVYSTDTLGSSVSLIGFDDAPENVLPLSVLGSTVESNLSFSAGAVDLTGKVLVVEYWIIVNSVPILANPTVTFQTVSTATTVQVPTSPSSTTYYLAMPALHSVGLDESLSAADSTARLYQAYRPATETVQISEGIAFHVTRTASDTVAVSDQITTNTSRPLSDSIAISDDPATNTGLPAADSATVADSIAKTYLAARPAADGVVVSESISFAVTRAVAETIAVSDGLVGKVAGRAISDSIGAADGISTNVAPRVADTITAADSISMSVTRSVSDALAAGDGAAASLSGQRAASDNLAIADSAARTYSASPQAADGVAVSDSLAATRVFFRQASETIALADQHAQTLAAARMVSDSTLVTEGAGRTQSASVQLSDAVAVVDSIASQPGLSDRLAVADSVSVAFPRSVSDSITVQDAAATARGSPASDSLQVADQITSVTVDWSRGFEESLALSDCTPFSCNQALQLGEQLALADEFSPPPGPEEALEVSDSIAATLPRGAGETIAIASSAGTVVRPLPASPPSGSPLSALGALVVSDAALVGPLPAEPVAGQYSMSGGNPGALVDELGLPALEIESVSDLTSAIVVLPTYHVTLSPSDELPGDDALLTVRVAEIPAETQVIVPVDIASTPAATEHDSIPSMTLGFTPAVDASDFALVVSIIDSPPGGAPEPEGDLVPLYLDVRWVGTFDGGVDPGAAGFYSDPPEFTFAVSQDWAEENDVALDENGVPAIALALLNESTGEWEEVDDIDVPERADEDGRYVYVARLEHFSTYALAASVDSGSGSSRPSGSRLSVQLADSLALEEEQAQTVTEEPAASRLAVRLLDSVSIHSTPVAYWPLEAGEDVSVLVTVADIRPAGIFPPAASVLVSADVTNRGTQVQTLALEFSHGGSRSSAAVVVGPGESRQVFTEVTFTAPGAQALTAETRTASGDLVSSLEILIDVPWLAVYMYLVTTLLGVLATIAGAGFYLFARQKFA